MPIRKGHPGELRQAWTHGLSVKSPGNKYISRHGDRLGIKPNRHSTTKVNFILTKAEPCLKINVILEGTSLFLGRFCLSIIKDSFP